MKQHSKKILIVSDFFYPHWTGLSKSLFNLVKTLKQSSRVTVLTVRYNKTLPQSETVEGALVIRTPATFSFSRTHFSLSFIPVFLRLILKHDTVFINSPCTYALPAALFSRLLGKRTVLFHQGDLILPGGFINRIIELVFDFSTKASCFLANSVASYTDDYARHSRILKLFLGKFTPLLIPVRPPSRIKSNNRILSVLNGMKKRKMILFGFAGRFVEEKGFDVLFQAIPHILEKVPRAHFVFAGEIRMGYEQFFDRKQRLWKRVEKNVTRLGLLKEDDLSAFYRHIDYLIMPSRSDCYGLVQIEAMLSGTPVIATNIPGLRIPVRETGFGLLFRKNDPIDLSESVIRAVKTRKSLMGKRAKALRYLDYDELAKKIKEYFAR